MGARKIRPMDDVSEETFEPGKTDSKSRGERGSARKVAEPPRGADPESFTGMPPPGFDPYAEPPRPPSKYPKYGAILLIIAALTLIFPAYTTLTMTQDDYMEPLQDDTEKITVTGTVYTENFTGIDKARVWVIAFDETQTDDEGDFRLSELPPGKITINVQKEGYKTIEHKIFLEGSIMGIGGSGNTNYDLEFIMEPGNGTVQSGNHDSETYETLAPILQICGIGFIIAFIFMIIAAVFGMQRRRFAFVIIGCVAGIFFGLNALLIGTALSVIAIILFYKSKREFS
jgi:hypothetical protein